MKLCHLGCTLHTSTTSKLPHIFRISGACAEIWIFFMAVHQHTDSCLLFQKRSTKRLYCIRDTQKSKTRFGAIWQKAGVICESLLLSLTCIQNFIQIGSGLGELKPKNPSAAPKSDRNIITSIP